MATAAVTIDELTLADEPERWRALGFAVASESCWLGDVRLRLRGRDAGRGIVCWSLRDLLSTDLDGLGSARSEYTADEGHRAGDDPEGGPGVEHPNGALAIDHIVAISPALDRSVRALQAAGLELRRIREEPTLAGAPRQAFYRLGAEILELVQEPPEAIERAGGPDRPAFFWGLALRVADLERTVAELGERVGSIRPAVQPGRRIATLRREAGLAVPVALIS
jgi:hypothetical protein